MARVGAAGGRWGGGGGGSAHGVLFATLCDSIGATLYYLQHFVTPWAPFAIIYNIWRPHGRSATLCATLQFLKGRSMCNSSEPEGLQVGLRSGRGGRRML